MRIHRKSREQRSHAKNIDEYDIGAMIAVQRHSMNSWLDQMTDKWKVITSNSTVKTRLLQYLERKVDGNRQDVSAAEIAKLHNKAPTQ